MEPIELLEFVLDLLSYGFVGYISLIAVRELAQMIQKVFGNKKKNNP